MLQIIKDLPDNVLGVSAEGKITAKDYETVLIPALEEKLKTHKSFRLLYHLGAGFTGIDFGAMIDDAKIGFKHISELERVALVSDHQMINTFARFFGHLMSCESRVFSDQELEEAKKWITENK